MSYSSNYDPGSPRTITHLHGRVYKVESFTGQDADYTVDLDVQTCTCPHYERVLRNTHGKCKHLQEAERREANYPLVVKARKLPDTQLQLLWKRYQAIDRLDVCQAIEIVRRERVLREQREVALKRLFS